LCRIVLLGELLAILAAVGATTLVFKTIERQAAQQRASAAEPIDPAMAILDATLGAESRINLLVDESD
jgi:uncharacterized membrane protein